VFFRVPRASILTAISFSLVLSGCAREKRGVERLAVIAFDNLSSDAALDWMRRATALGIVHDLAGAPELSAQSFESLNGASAVQASQVLEGYFFQRHGRLELRATMRDAQKPRTVAAFEAAGPIEEGLAPLVDTIAKRLSPSARGFGSVKPEAFHAYGEAMMAPDRAAAVRQLESAREADPRFSAAHIALAQVLLGTGDRDGALKAIKTAEAARADAIDRAELDFVSASARGDLKDREKALEALTRAKPADSKSFRDLAEVQLLQRQFQAAVRSYEAAARLNPEEPRNWNELGYALSYVQDLAGARKALETYQRLVSSEDINALDSLGEVSFYLGDFSAAAKYFLQAYEKNPAAFGGGELVKAAQATLMNGDLGKADTLFEKYIANLQGPQRARAAYQLAQWEFVTGRRKAAMAGLERAIEGLDADGQSLGLSQLSIWKLETGDAKKAVDLASQAVARAATPQTRNVGLICRAIASGAGGSGSRAADAYAFLMARKYAEALPLLEALFRETNPSGDGQIRTLLAWTYVELGRVADARALVKIYPFPFSISEPLLASLAFPRFLFLRGVVLQDEGKGGEAKRCYELFLKYAGDVPDVFGSEVVAKRNLGAGG
jgi:tetratricopeptide (TPR) repeat protein